jgi:hypothetical protein
VRDADTVKRELQSIGPAGEQALARLEAAAQRAAGRSGGGGMRALATATQEVDARFSGVGQKIGQAGFQIQDFAVQVQGGTNALTALSQQGSQLLGVFGTGGAIAGAVLTVGLLATQLLGMGETAEQAAKRIEEGFKANQRAGEDLTRVVRDLSAELLTAAERAAALANAQRNVLVVEGQQQMLRLTNEQTAAVQQYTQAQGELTRVQTARARLEADLAAASPRGRAAIESDLREVRGAEFGARSRFDAARSEMDRTGTGIAGLRRLVDQVSQIRTGPEEFGPPNPDTPESRAAARRAEAAGRAAARRDAALATRLEERDLASEERGNAAALREYEAALRSIETPMERFHRQVVELGELEARLREAGTPLSSEDEQRIFESYRQQLARAQASTSGLNDATRELGLTFSSAFEDAIVKGEDLRKVLDGVAQDLARIILRQTIVNPLANAATSAIGSLGNVAIGLFGGSAAPAAPTVPSALGNAFLAGRLTPFAAGGVVDRATAVPMALMGEAGPEAVMPLDRDSSGRLGVRANRGVGGGITQNITIDARGADPSVVPLIRAAMAQAKREAQAEMMASIQRGGRAAQVVGRRR